MADAPAPLIEKGKPVDWWFVFKFNAAIFPKCGGAKLDCIFGGDPQDDKKHGQQFVYGSSASPEFKQGTTCAGNSLVDPIGATFDQIHNGSLNYIIWNDQFYDDPAATMCKSCGVGTGHSKGVLAWDDEGEGFVMQVTTPSWPGAGDKKHKRQAAGNTLGCIVKPNNVMVSQHFFALKLTKEDLATVLKALQHASVVADPANRQVAKTGGPAEIRKLVAELGSRSDSTEVFHETLSSGVEVVAKPAKLLVPPWQMLSAEMGGVGLRTATWWNNKKIWTTNKSSKITCWDESLGKPGPVQIALTGQWAGKEFELTGGGSPSRNHAKIGVTTTGESYAIFGDLNQEGSISKTQKCTTAQNARGGLFYLVKDDNLHANVTKLIKGDTAPAKGPKKPK